MSYYEDLGIERSATSSAIKKAYKALAASTHPDKPGGEHEAFIKVQESLWGHERYWDRAVPIFGQANWNNVGFTKTDMQKSFRDLPSMMNPPEEMVRASIEDYKKKKLSL